MTLLLQSLSSRYQGEEGSRPPLKSRKGQPSDMAVDVAASRQRCCAEASQRKKKKRKGGGVSMMFANEEDASWQKASKYTNMTISGITDRWVFLLSQPCPPGMFSYNFLNAGSCSDTAQET